MVLVLSSGASCRDSTGIDVRDGAILFIGNSLTYTNDLPGMVQALFAADGVDVDVHEIAKPDYSLEDHWNDNVRAEIAAGRWSVVVMQQGPSALPASRVLLRDYVRRLDPYIRATGAVPAMYMVWPSLDRSFDFDEVRESYRLAAHDIGGLFFPAGEAWRAAWERDASLRLYGPDGFHPTVEGTYATALVIYATLSHRSPVGLPTTLELRGSGTVALRADHAALLQQGAAQAITRYGAP